MELWANPEQMLSILVGLSAPRTPHLRDIHVLAPTLGPQPQRGSKGSLGAPLNNTGNSSGMNLDVRDEGAGKLIPVPGDSPEPSLSKPLGDQRSHTLDRH
eukprot:15456725-Alexandrium_andersonii.AAC.1